MPIDLDTVATQEAFADLVDVTQPRVAQLVADGVLPRGGTLRQWLHAYCARLREQAAGRASDGPLDLSQERAALAREQRKGIEIKNAVLRGEYAAVSLLTEVLATASQAVNERFEHLPGAVRKASPDLDPLAIDAVMAVIASARNEWVRQTSSLVAAHLDSLEEPEIEVEDEPGAD